MPRTAQLTFLGHVLKRTPILSVERSAGGITMRAHVDIRLGPTKGDRVGVRVYGRKYGGCVAHCTVGAGGYLLEQVVSGEPDPQLALDELERVTRKRFTTLATLFDYELEE